MVFFGVSKSEWSEWSPILNSILCQNSKKVAVVNETLSAFSGFITDQKEFEARIRNESIPSPRQTGPGMAEPVERFQLNNLSFAGPVIMGVGGNECITLD